MKAGEKVRLRTTSMGSSQEVLASKGKVAVGTAVDPVPVRPWDVGVMDVEDEGDEGADEVEEEKEEARRKGCCVWTRRSSGRMRRQTSEQSRR